MASQQIVYNSKIITFERPPAKGSFKYRAAPPRIVNTGLDGSTETITQPRCDVSIEGQWPITSARIRDQLDNWFQWALQGNSFTWAWDADNAVSTTLSAGASGSANQLTLTSTAGIKRGGRYVVKDGAAHQVITVEDVAGSIVTIEGSLDGSISNGSIFRDHYYLTCEIRDRSDVEFTDTFINVPAHITHQGTPPRESFAWLRARFFESSTATGAVSGVTHIDNETPSGAINGSNRTFVLANTPVTGSVRLFYRSSYSGHWVLWNTTAEYTISSATITTAFAPIDVDALRAWYRT